MVTRVSFSRWRQAELSGSCASPGGGSGDVRRNAEAGANDGSGFASTRSVCSSRNFRSASRIAGCFAPKIAAASNAELIAPALPIASVPTGMPPGICAIERSESKPFNAFDSTGTPSTGSTVFEAVMPGRCAAPPAPAIKTSRPRCSAVDAYSNSKSGVRWAETTRVS